MMISIRCFVVECVVCADVIIHSMLQLIKNLVLGCFLDWIFSWDNGFITRKKSNPIPFSFNNLSRNDNLVGWFYESFIFVLEILQTF